MARRWSPSLHILKPLPGNVGISQIIQVHRCSHWVPLLLSNDMIQWMLRNLIQQKLMDLNGLNHLETLPFYRVLFYRDLDCIARYCKTILLTFHDSLGIRFQSKVQNLRRSSCTFLELNCHARKKLFHHFLNLYYTKGTISHHACLSKTSCYIDHVYTCLHY